MLNLAPLLIQRLTHPEIWLGLSGGLDSVVLLHLLSSYPDIKSRLHAIHVHHGISKNADTWALFCEELCQNLAIPLVIEKVKLNNVQNLEANARALRYQAYEKHVPAHSALCLAHHLDDDVETFFLQALRGTGVRGLAGIDPYRLHADIAIFRPLLDYPRSHLLSYANAHSLSWVDDESNTDIQYFRNYLRQDILPRIEQKWPHYRQSLQHTMHSCRELVEFLEPKQSFTRQLHLKDHTNLNDFEWQQLLRSWIKANTKYYPSQKILQQILSQMIHAKRRDNEAIIHLGDYRLIAYRQVLELFLYTELPIDLVWDNYPHPIEIPSYGTLHLPPEIRAKFPVQAHDLVSIRFRRGGEKIRHATQSLCLKKQFQARAIPPYQRGRIPLLYINENLCHVFFPCLEADGVDILGSK